MSLFVEKYRPKTIQDCILPKSIKKSFQEFVDKKNCPNLMLCGSAGTGKTTIARALAEEMYCELKVVNCSQDRGIDTLRNEMVDFCSRVSLEDRRKILLLDEADYLTPLTQAALRGFIENYHITTTFILTCNLKHQIIPPLHSRCSVIDFDYDSTEKPELMSQLYKRVTYILDDNTIEYDNKVLFKLINAYYPDNRRILNELQRYSTSGNVDSAILADFESPDVADLIQSLKNKDFMQLREWILDNIDVEPQKTYQMLYVALRGEIAVGYFPDFVQTIADGMYKSNFVADAEIQMTADLTRIMRNAIWK